MRSALKESADYQEFLNLYQPIWLGGRRLGSGKYGKMALGAVVPRTTGKCSTGKI